MISAAAEVVEPSEDFWYLDEANVLSEATEGEIFFANQRLYDACGAEIVVVTVDSTGGMTIEDYAYTLFNEWEIGGNTYRGLLLLMAIGDDDYYVMPGTVMNEYFDSATIGNLMDKYLEPDFAEKDYDSAARLFFEAAYEKTVDDLNLNLSIADAKADYEEFVQKQGSVQQGSTVSVETLPYEEYGRRNGSGSVLPVLIVMFLALFIILRSSPGRARRREPYRSSSRSASMMTGFILGRMSSRRHPGPFAEPRMGGRPPIGNPGGMNRSRPGGFSGRNVGGFGGASRSTFGGMSRSSGGFGGASRSGGASRGPSTRGGGAGRFSRR